MHRLLQIDIVYLCIVLYVKLDMCTNIYISIMPYCLTSYCLSNCMRALSEYGCGKITLPLQHFLAFFLPNDAATVGDIRVSYVASLISAYAKLSFFLPPLSLSLCWRFVLYGQHFLHPLSLTALSSYWQTVQSHSARWVCIIACLQEWSLPPPHPRAPPFGSKFDFNAESGEVQFLQLRVVLGVEFEVQNTVYLYEYLVSIRKKITIAVSLWGLFITSTHPSRPLETQSTIVAHAKQRVFKFMPSCHLEETRHRAQSAQSGLEEWQRERATRLLSFVSLPESSSFHSQWHTAPVFSLCTWNIYSQQQSFTCLVPRPCSITLTHSYSQQTSWKAGI